MLQRLIGEDIHLSWEPSAGLWPVKMDPTQVDQILANLSVNARDAIEGVGRRWRGHSQPRRGFSLFLHSRARHRGAVISLPRAFLHHPGRVKAASPAASRFRAHQNPSPTSA